MYVAELFDIPVGGRQPGWGGDTELSRVGSEKRYSVGDLVENKRVRRLKRKGNNWIPAGGRQIQRAPHNCLPDRPPPAVAPALRCDDVALGGDADAQSIVRFFDPHSQVKGGSLGNFPCMISTRQPAPDFGSAPACWLQARWPSPLWGWRPPRRRRRYRHPLITITGAPATTGIRAGVPTPTGTTATTGTTFTAPASAHRRHRGRPRRRHRGRGPRHRGHHLRLRRHRGHRPRRRRHRGRLKPAWSGIPMRTAGGSGTAKYRSSSNRYNLTAGRTAECPPRLALAGRFPTSWRSPPGCLDPVGSQHKPVRQLSKLRRQRTEAGPAASSPASAGTAPPIPAPNPFSGVRGSGRCGHGVTTLHRCPGRSGSGRSQHC